METVKELKLSISLGNSKLPETTFIFNLPAVKTCPLKTVLCAKECYALKAEVQYKHVVPQARNRNLEISRSDYFVNRISNSIDQNIKKIKQVRIHESGDFYSQEYLEKWFKITTLFPELTFYAYTKSFHLDYSAKPKNFVLIASFDKTTDQLRRNFYESKREQFDNTFTIVDKGVKASCIADCSKCDMCWTAKGKEITVEQH